MRVDGANNITVVQQDAKSKVALQDSKNVVILKAAQQQAATPGKEEPEENVDLKKLEKAVEFINKTMETHGTELRFSIHKESGEYLVQVIETQNNEVIREIPPERVLDFVAHIKKMLGIIIDKFI